jgi:hypothetical protein
MHQKRTRVRYRFVPLRKMDEKIKGGNVRVVTNLMSVYPEKTSISRRSKERRSEVRLHIFDHTSLRFWNCIGQKWLKKFPIKTAA